ncbi:hypothetical protein [Mesorhizobium sp. ES1-1]|uniref:hypothetical protein n=1 Tax=Mesorhizobium sp. ES1-1 TaxID=2876629 RepID=UPI001CCA6E28|nr:hypothetical protein [Mesorhizobium sp. ES1-1]MBZ9675141.1 hypothetical protein [Mesorhizobium sp. ES1-1]
MAEIEADRYALVSEGTVVNVILWDGNTETWAPPAGSIAVLCPDEVGTGWTYVHGDWQAPAEIEEESGA